jgi:hypothetical protein
MLSVKKVRSDIRRCVPNSTVGEMQQQTLTLHLPSQQWLKGAAIDKMR